MRTIPAMAAACPDDEVLARVAAGDAGSADRERVMAHLDECATCRRGLAITLEPGQALVVFGGGNPAPIAGVRIATGRLYLNNDADAVVIRDRGGSELASATYGAEAGFDEAIVRRTELDPDAVFVRHTEVNGQRTTPGLRANGEPF